jgi:hypothetical protein
MPDADLSKSVTNIGILLKNIKCSFKKSIETVIFALKKE